MNDKWHWLRHKWSAWTQYEQRYSFRYHTGDIIHGHRTEIRQSRKCLICGKSQDEEVAYDGRLVPNEDYQRRAIQLQSQQLEDDPELFGKAFWQDFNVRFGSKSKPSD